MSATENRPRAEQEASIPAYHHLLTPLLVELLRCDPSGAKALALLDGAWADLEPPLLAPRRAEIQCQGAGCAACCAEDVNASVLEAARVAAYLRAHPEVLRQVQEGWDEKIRRIRRTDAGTRVSSQVPCALLGTEGQCLVHPVRPYVCRGMYSVDRDRCYAEQIQTILVEALGVASALVAALVDALATLKYRTPYVELSLAVDVLLRRPAQLRRWREGRADFGEALTRRGERGGALVVRENGKTSLRVW